MHAGASVCTPARAAILTGRLGPRTGVKKNFAQSSLYGLSLTELTLPELLKPQGYDTLAIGKWHLGHSDEYQPTSRGFDGWYGVPYSWDLGCADGTNGVDWHDGVCSTSHKRYGCPTWWGDDNMCKGCAAQSPGIPVFLDYTIVEQPANLSMLTTHMTDYATEFIRAHATTGAGDADGTAPFFLYYPMTHVHAPVAYHPKYTNTSTAQSIFADSLRELDASMGAIVDAVAEAGQTDNTLIIFTSDNGPWNIKCDWTERSDGLSGSMGPYLGAYQTSTLGGGGATGKFTSWEGGHRMPTFMVWPGVIIPGRVDNHLLSHTDIVPTVVSLAGGELPTDRIYDGVDLGPLLFANGGAGEADASEDPYVYHRYLLHDIAPYSLTETDNVQAVRVGDHKVFFSHCGASACNEIYYTCSRDGRPTKRTLVFDLSADPAESSPLEVLSDSAAALALVEARTVLRDFEMSLEDDFHGNTDFSHGSHPDSWPCCNPDNLSCRCGESVGALGALGGSTSAEQVRDNGAVGVGGAFVGLVEALRELATAKAEGLLTQSEYDGLRQAAMVKAKQ
mmetsp:Transcript_26/g.53  ORF Transcript_26/g.53 Transcript_26/m.53 type:complete len:562 (+) Transcript_26:1-1686(+)